MAEITLSDHQDEALCKIVKWHKEGDSQIFVLGGYAGTGKTTLAKRIAQEIGGVHFCAFTGKAAHVLKEKGCKGAATIHSSIYKYEGKDNVGRMIMSLDPESVFQKRRLVIVDEYSMVPVSIFEDMLKFGTKILFLGDPFQLPPVRGFCSLEPEHFLTEVHRQALESPILRFATQIREDGRIGGVVRGDEFSLVPHHELSPADYLAADQLIVGRNATRRGWNKRVRQLKGFVDDLPQQGDKLICLKNNREKGIFNGMIGTAEEDASIGYSSASIHLMFNYDDRVYDIPDAWDGFFTGKPTDQAPDWKDQFDYGYAITGHKSQGSEFENVIAKLEPIGRGDIEKRRWIYTVATRASKKLTLVKQL